MKKIHTKRGFTMAEILLALAILAVLAGLSTVAAFAYRENVTRLKLDGIAKEIFVAAQNHLTIANTQGLVEGKISDSSDFSPYGHPASIEGITGGYYYLLDKYNLTSKDNPDNEASVLNLMLPQFSVDENIRKGSNGYWLIRYVPDAAQVWDVFYWEDPDSGLQNYDNCVGTAANHYTYTASGRKILVGHYGVGSDASGGSLPSSEISVPTETLEPPSLTVKNSHVLSVEIQDNIKDINGHYIGNLRLMITGKTSHNQFVTDILDKDANGYAVVYLDDITIGSGNRFSAVYRDKGFIPGEDLELQAWVFKEGGTSFARSDTQVTNSLFAGIENGEILVSSIRHLENLDDNKSQFVHNTLFPNSLAAPVPAKQIEDLDFQEFLDDADTNSAYLYSPVTPGYHLSYRGEHDAVQHTPEGYLAVPKISNVTMTAAGSSGSYGIFGELSGTETEPVSIQNLELVDCSVNASGTTISGALAGSLEWCEVKNVAAYTSNFNTVQNDDAHKTSNDTEAADYAKITGGQYAGGLVGTLTHGSLNQCASSMVVRAGDGSGAAIAGGLVGQAEDVSITASYASGHASGEGKFITSDWQKANVYANGTSDSVSGGLVGSADGLYAENCYTTNSVSANDSAASIGGLVGKLSPSADEPYLESLGDAIQNRITVSSIIRNVVLHCRVLGTAYTPPANPDDAPLLHPFIGMDVPAEACQFKVNPSDTDLVNYYLVGLVSNAGSSGIAGSLSPRSVKAENVIAPDASKPILLSNKREKAAAYAQIFNDDYKGRFYYYTIAQILQKPESWDTEKIEKFKANNPAFLFVHYGDWQVPGVGTLPFTVENGNRLYVPVTVGDASGAQTEKIVLSVEGQTSQRLREITLEAVTDADGKITHYAPKFTEDYTITRTTDPDTHITDVTQTPLTGLAAYPLSVEVKDGDGGDAVTKATLILDDITRKNATDPSAHFADLFPGFYPGEELVVRVVDATVIFADLEASVPANDGSDPTRTDPVNITNSLFARSVNPDQTGGTLNLSCIRHLQNLDTAVSKLDTDHILAQNARLTADLTADNKADWNNFTAEMEKKPGESWDDVTAPKPVKIYGADGTAYADTFHPITSPKLVNFNWFNAAGMSDSVKKDTMKEYSHTIQNVVIDGEKAGTNYAALFAPNADGVNKMENVSYIHLEQFTVKASSSGNAGTLFPAVEKSVTLDRVLSEGETASVTAVGTGMAGGLIGTINNGTVNINSSAATVYVSASGAAGGLVGGQSGGSLNINQSYAGGHTSGERYTVNGYSEDDAGRWNVYSSGNAAGGLVGSVGSGVTSFSATESFSAASVHGDAEGAGGVVGRYAHEINLDKVYAIAPVDNVSRYKTETDKIYEGDLTGEDTANNAGALLGVEASGGSVRYTNTCYYLPEVYHDSFIGKDTAENISTANICSTAAGNAPSEIHLAYYSPDRDKGITAKEDTTFLEQKTSFYDSAFDQNADANSGKPLNNEFPFSMWTKFSFSKDNENEKDILHYYGDWQPVDTSPLKLTLKYAYDDVQEEKRDENHTIAQQELYLRPGFDQEILLQKTPFRHLYEYSPWAVESETAKAAAYNPEASGAAIAANAQTLTNYGLTFHSVQDAFGVMRIALAAYRTGTGEPEVTLVSPVERIPNQHMVEFRIPSTFEDKPGQYYTLKKNASDAGTSTALTLNSGYKSGAEAYRESRARTGKNGNQPLLRDIRVPDPVIEGYVFDGWFTTPDNTPPSDPASGGTLTAEDFSDSSTKEVTRDTVFYAHFHAIRTYSITVDFLYDLGDTVQYLANVPKYRVKDNDDNEVAQYVIQVPVGEPFDGNIALPEVNDRPFKLISSHGGDATALTEDATFIRVSETDSANYSREEYTAVYEVYYHAPTTEMVYYQIQLNLKNTGSGSSYPWNSSASQTITWKTDLMAPAGAHLDLELSPVGEYVKNLGEGGLYAPPKRKDISYVPNGDNTGIAQRGTSSDPEMKKQQELAMNIVTVNVERAEYNIIFDTGGYADLEPKSVPAGAPVSGYLYSKSDVDRDIPSSANRSFDNTQGRNGWTLTKVNGNAAFTAANMPTEDLRASANWKYGKTKVTLVYWDEKANSPYLVTDPLDPGYSYKVENIVTYFDYSGSKTISNLEPFSTFNGNTYADNHYTANDLHFQKDTSHADVKVIQPDGSTVINVFYLRKLYTLEFKYSGVEIIPNDILVVNPTQTSTATITAKYGSDISGCFPIEVKYNTGSSSRPNWVTTKSTYWTPTTSSPDLKLEKRKPMLYLQTMPDQSSGSAKITLNGERRDELHTLRYYVEDSEGNVTYSGVKFRLCLEFKHKYGFLQPNLDFYYFDGFRHWKYNSSGSVNVTGTFNYDSNGDAILDTTPIGQNAASRAYTLNVYYLRKNYPVSFYDGENYLGEVSIPYDAPLSRYSSQFPSPLPNGANPDDYEEYGWTQDPNGAIDYYDLVNGRMPLGGLVLYAKRVHKPVTLTLYPDKSAYDHAVDGSGNVANAWFEDEDAGHTHADTRSFTVPYEGSARDQMYDEDNNALAQFIPHRANDADGTSYSFKRWRYKDGGTEKTFLAAMDLTENVAAYPEWEITLPGTTAPVTVEYGYMDGDTWTLLDSKLIDPEDIPDGEPKPTINEFWTESSISIAGYQPKDNMVSILVRESNNVMRIEYTQIEPWYYTAEFYLRLGHGDSAFTTAEPVMTAQFPAYNEYETVTFRFPGPDDPSTPGPTGCSEDIRNHYRFHALQYGDLAEQSSSRVLIHPVKVSEGVAFPNSDHKSRAVVNYYLTPDETTMEVSSLESLYNGTALGFKADPENGGADLLDPKPDGGVYTLCNELMPPEIRSSRIEVRLDYTFYEYQDSVNDWIAFPDGTYPTDAGIYQFDTAVNAHVPDNNQPIRLWEASDRQNLVIRQREITMTSASGSQPYNADEVLKLDKPGDVTVTGDGWADGEGADYTFSVDSFRRNKGTSYNVFNYVLHANTKAQNYSIRKVYGTLTVT